MGRFAPDAYNLPRRKTYTDIGGITLETITPRKRTTGPIRQTNRDFMDAQELEMVRAHRRRHPHPPAPATKRRPKNVKVGRYVRRKAGADLPPLNKPESESEREWIDYLASFYGITKAQARKMERETRP